MSEEHIPLYSIKDRPQQNRSTYVNKFEEEKIVRRRKIREDKCHPIKFPLSKDEQIRLKVACKKAELIYKDIYGYDQKLTQTHFNTLLLRYALKQLDIESIDWKRIYKDTNLYLHTKPTEIEYQLIGGPDGLATINGISERKLVYYLVLTIFEILERQGAIKNVLL